MIEPSIWDLSKDERSGKAAVGSLELLVTAPKVLPLFRLSSISEAVSRLKTGVVELFATKYNDFSTPILNAHSFLI